MTSIKRSILFLTLFVFIVLAGCETVQLYEQNTSYPDHQWASKQSNTYKCSIADTNALYNVYFVIRHHNAYHYKNIWVELSTKSPSGIVTKEAANLNLADDEKGWLGTGMDDIYDQRIPITAQPIKLKKGVYEFTLQHTMREDPLQNILATGIRVEKVK